MKGQKYHYLAFPTVFFRNNAPIPIYVFIFLFFFYLTPNPMFEDSNPQKKKNQNNQKNVLQYSKFKILRESYLKNNNNNQYRKTSRERVGSFSD